MKHPIIAGIAAALVIIAGAALFPALVLAKDCGKASFYADAHHGRTMANGQPFNMHALTAASNTLPLGSRARVTAGKRSVLVTITDTGGFGKYGRIIDLSKAAFAKLAPTRQGIVHVCVARL